MRTNGHGKPVVALDIDGTLGDYHGHFLRFASGWFGIKFPDPEEINPGLPLHAFMEVGVREYRECKLAYRQGGLKRTMPAYIGASQLTRDIRAAGAEVWICTSRPYLRLDNIDPDTREWLSRNGIEYDAVLFDTLDGKGTKYRELARQAGDRVCAVMDDLPEMIYEARQHLPHAHRYLRDQPYNKHAELTAGSRRVTSCWTAWCDIKFDILQWKKDHDG